MAILKVDNRHIDITTVAENLSAVRIASIKELDVDSKPSHMLWGLALTRTIAAWWVMSVQLMLSTRFRLSVPVQGPPIRCVQINPAGRSEIVYGLTHESQGDKTSHST